MKKKIFISILLVLTVMLTFVSCFNGIANKKVNSIQIISGVPTEVTVGETPDFSALKAKVTYNDGEIKEVGYDDVIVSSIDTSKAGKVNYFITYDGYSVPLTITVKTANGQGPSVTEATLESISLVPGTIRTEFVVGEDFHTNNIQVIAHYSDGTTPTISSSNLTITKNIDPDTVGEQTLIVTYKNKKCEIKITVKPLEATRISLNLEAFNSEILIGTALDTSSITGTVHYNNSSTTPLANADITFSTVDTSAAGAKTLVATYNGLQTECNVTVLGIKSIEFSGFATKIKPGENLDLSGVTATVTATNNATFTIDASDIDVDRSGFDNTLTNTSYKTTTLKLGYCGTVVDYEITVEATLADAALEGIELKSGVKTNLFVGEVFDDSAIVFKAIYTYGFVNNNVTKNKLTVSGAVDTSVAGTYPVTYTLSENSVTKSFTVNVEVVEPTPTELVLNTEGFTNWVIKGEALDISSITATLKYNYAGKTTVLANADLTITGIDTATAGNKTITVSYGNINATVAYTVVTVDSVEIVGGISSTVSLGDTAYEDNLRVKATLSNGEVVYRGLDGGVTVDVTAFNSTVVGTYPITVSFGGKATTANVAVIEVIEELLLQGIEIQQGLATSMFAGDSYSYDALKITAYFNYGITKTYTIAQGVEVTTSGSTDEAGTYTITASYTHEGVTKSASLDVTVVAVVATSIKIDAGSFAATHYIDGAYSTAGITATVYYNKPGYTTTLISGELDIEVDTSTVGEKSLTVAYGDLTDTATVQVIGIKSVVFEGVDERYRVNNQISTSDITVAITYDDDTTRDISYDASTMVIPTLALDESVTKETKEYVFSYLGVEYTQIIEVYAEFADATLVSIEYTGATEVLVGGSLEGKLSVKAYYTYGFTKDYTDGVTATALDTATKGERTVTVSYLNKTVEATVTVRYPRVTDVVVNSAPIAIKGEAYDFGAINLTLTLENNKTISGYLANLADYEIEAVLDVTSAGSKTLTLTANGKSYNHAITVYEIEKIVINVKGLNNIVQLGSEFSVDGLSEIYVYLVGMSEPVIRPIDSTNITHNVNTAVASKDYTLTATYLGVVSAPIKITVTDQEFVITGADDPASLVGWKTAVYQSQFLDQGYSYVVGDDNPFKYELRFRLFDVINRLPSKDSQTLSYVGISSVKLNGEVVGEEYVTVDDVNHTFDFTEEAIGKTFVITTAHKDYVDFTKELTVTVVDGYNVHESIELNLLTNRNDTISSAEGIYQLEVLYEFLQNNKVAGIENMDYTTYKAFVDGINGIILHNNFTLSTADFPDKYFFKTSNGTKYLWDHESLYYREFTDLSIYNVDGATPEVFNLYGNYFTVLTYNIPIVAEKGMTNNNGTATNEDDQISSSQLFRFNVSDAIWNNAIVNNAFYHENYVANIYALGTRDDNPSLAVQPETAQVRSRLGIYAFKLASGTYNLNAVNAQAFFNTMTAEYDDLTVNIDYCSFYNAWNNHISTWTSNRIDDNEAYDPKGEVKVHAGYDPTTINISNSFVGKSGGPAILAMVENPDKEYNIKAGSKPIINIDENTNIFSYVKGDESWFVSYNATAIAGQLSSYNNYFPEGSTFLTKIGAGENNFMNMICLFMDAHFNPATLDGVNTDINGSLSIGGKTIIDMNSSESGMYGHGGAVDMYRNLTQSQDASGNPVIPPIFVSDAGGICFTDTQTAIYEITQTGLAPITSADHAAVQGDNLAMFLYNLGLHVGFNEPVLSAEPTPADCTVEKVITSHGYGN